MLGALYGGKTAVLNMPDIRRSITEKQEPRLKTVLPPDAEEELEKALFGGLGIVRSEKDILSALEKIRNISEPFNARIFFAEAVLLSALERRESRGAHYREDYPETDENCKKTTVAKLDIQNGEYKINISFQSTEGYRNEDKV